MCGEVDGCVVSQWMGDQIDESVDQQVVEGIDLTPVL